MPKNDNTMMYILGAAAIYFLIIRPRQQAASVPSTTPIATRGLQTVLTIPLEQQQRIAGGGVMSVPGSGVMTPRDGSAGPVLIEPGPGVLDPPDIGMGIRLQPRPGGIGRGKIFPDGPEGILTLDNVY